MAKKQPVQIDDAVEVRALQDHENIELGIELKAGKLGLVPKSAVDSLKGGGIVDDHPDAVAYARQQAEREAAAEAAKAQA